MIRFQITLEPIEAELLAKWASSELRDPRDQIHFIIRRELEKRGLTTTSELSKPLGSLEDKLESKE